MADEVKDTPEARALRLYDALLKDKSLSAAVKKKTTEIFPDVDFPELAEAEAAVAPVQAKLDKLMEELAKEREERAKEKEERESADFTRKFEERIQAAREKYSLTDEGFEKMTERMKSLKNYEDADAAAAWVAQQTPAPARVNKADWMPMRIGQEQSIRENKELMDLLHTDPQGFELHMIQEFLDSPDDFTRAAGLAA